MITNNIPEDVTLVTVDLENAWLCPKAVEVYYQGKRLLKVALSATGTHVAKSAQNKLVVVDNGHDDRQSIEANLRWCSGHVDLNWAAVARQVSRTVRDNNKCLRPTHRFG